MTEKEKELAENAVRDSVNGLREAMLLNFKLDPEVSAYINQIAEQEIKYGLDDIDRIDHPIKSNPSEWYVETNPHWPM